jgi:uncharacterized protein DUF4013
MKIMFKKIFYPFTDWAWLKLTLATIFMTGLVVSFMVVVFGSAFFWERSEVVVAHLSLASVLLSILGVLLGLLFVGYLKRVARQPDLDPLKLPKLIQPVTLIKEGFLTMLGSVLSTTLVGLVLGIPFAICSVLFLVGTSLLVSDSPDAMMVVGSLGISMFYLVAFLVFLAWVSFLSPLQAVRYSYTGRFRSFFEYRWVWNAVTIAPLEYLARTMAWSILLIVVTILTPLTAGLAGVLGYILTPYSTVNCAYLIGDYYETYLND